ncbi:MAG TPA: cysteine desulfurase [Bacteroidia bacterium]|nr:cysteine desulfurase [Bacteroidia bacterium]
MPMAETEYAKTKFNAEAIRSDFPVLNEKAYGKPLVYFDNAATSQKPEAVIKSISEYYSTYNANIHRGVHFLSQKASQAYDDVRKSVQQFINARSEREIVFTRGTTESINLVAASFGRKFISEGDEIIISAMEHHSNIVPWQLLCEEKGAFLKVIPMNDMGELILEKLVKLIGPKTRLIAVVHTSNSLGSVNAVKEIVKIARQNNIPVLVDGAQAVAHAPVDVTDLDCDFFAFSGHKMLGPTGIGCLYGKLELLDKMPPYQGGGEMIQSVQFEKTTFNEVPFKFEAGTPDIAGVIGLGAAINYINGMDRKGAAAHEQQLLNYATQKLSEISGIKIIGTAANKTAVVSFIIDGVNALDAGMYLDTLGIAVRTGHHCTEPVMTRFGIPGTIRASFMFYNTLEEVDQLVQGVGKAIAFLKRK